MYRQNTWRAFLSLGTLISGVMAVGVWSLQFDWLTGIFLVLLIYIHELGHVLAAVYRRLPVQSAPIFLPGVGAFVSLRGWPKAWDQVLFALGGPVLGGVAALAAKLAGVGWQHGALAFAGDFALLLNLLNLLPFAPLDGGHVVAETGWIGLLPTVLFGGYLIVTSKSVMLGGLAAYGIMHAYRLARTGRGSREGWGTRLAMLGLYLATGLSLYFALKLSGRAAWLPAANHPWLMPIQLVTGGFFAAMLVSGWLLPHLWREAQGARLRYVGAAVIGWPWYLVRHPWAVPALGMLAAHTLGLETLSRLERLIGYVADRGGPAAGFAWAWGYDCLRREGRLKAAEAWLVRAADTARKADIAVIEACAERLLAMKYVHQSHVWLLRCLDGLSDPASLPGSLANNLAWALFKAGRHAEAMPYVEAAVAAAPGQSAFLDTLGQVRLATGDLAGAEAALRQSVTVDKRGSTRAALARALAAQGRYAEAADEAEVAVTEKEMPWPADEPGADEVRQLAVQWRQWAADAERSAVGALM